MADVAGAGGASLKLGGGELIADPEWDLEGRAVAEDEEGSVGEFVAGGVAGGVAEAVLLGGESGDECEEEVG